MSVTAQGTGAAGFVFEELMDQTLRRLVAPLASAGCSARILNEQQVRDEFGEQSLNGVDHYIALTWLDGREMLFLIQEKWKIVTNQREVSQFLDCCARILARLPDYKGRVVRLWVTRTMATQNSEKSLAEGGAYVIQSSTSMPALAVQATQFICELVGDRGLAAEAVAAAPSFLPGTDLLEPLTRGQQEKALPANAIHPAKVKVCVVRRDG